jgi:hypothetical protein
MEDIIIKTMAPTPSFSKYENMKLMQQLVSCLPIEDAIAHLIEELNVSTSFDASFENVSKSFGYDDDDE